jgi:hypothetical protein
MWPADIEGVLHERAMLWLRTHLRTQRGQAARGRWSVDDPIVAAGNEGRLLAVEYVGAIGGDQGAEWRQKLRDASVRPEPQRGSVSPEVRDRALSHLEGLAAGVSPEPGDSSAACLSVVMAYERSGVLSAAEALAWRERLRELMGLEPERPPLCTQRELHHVLAGPAERYQGLRITSVELYADGVVLRWHRARAWPDGPDTPRIWSRVEQETDASDDSTPRSLTDELGTPYVVGRAGAELGISGGGRLIRFGVSAFTPAVPADAKYLRVPLPDGGIDIELT